MGGVVSIMKAVIYARVSVREEDVNNQINEIKAWAKERGYNIAGIFPDIDVTGASNPLERPKFKSLLSFCQDNGINVILVWDLARFGRSLPESIEALRKLLERGFKVIFTRYNLVADLNDVAGKVMIYTLLMVAELERDFMKMRVEAAKKSGKICHRPPTPIPIDEVKTLLKKDWTLKQIYSYLLGKGYLRYKVKGEERQLSYKQFVYRLNALGIRKKR